MTPRTTATVIRAIVAAHGHGVIASAAGVSGRTVARWLSGENQPSVAAIDALHREGIVSASRRDEILYLTGAAGWRPEVSDV